MLRIRMVEEQIAARYPEQQMRCPVHLSIGQEAPSAAFSKVAERRDLAVSTHRGHAHYLAKGGNLNRMIAELYGKETGCSRGVGGSMHLIDTNAGFMGTSAIVGNSIPVGVGLALALQTKGIQQAACVFFGDGATEEGAFYESLNFAALRQLPALFLCENNQYSVYTSLEQRQPPERRIVEVSRSLGVKAFEVDGQSANESYHVLADVLPRVRAGAGPALIEFSTHRYLEHCGPNDDEHLGYRRQGELEQWKDRDPVQTLIRESHISQTAVAQMRGLIAREVDEAFEFARNSNHPDRDALRGLLYA